MIITCEKCETKYNLDETIVKKNFFKVRCSKCSHVFTAYKPSHEELQEIIKPEKIVEEELKTLPVNLNSNRIIAISNQKGGVAKTSTCLNLGISLSLLGKRVLLIDFDAQSNLSILLGYKNTKSFYDVLNSGQDGLSEFIEKTKYPNLWLLPSNRKMVLLAQKYLHGKNFEYLLQEKLNSVKDQYDYILIDTPPSVEFFTLNALIASDFVIIPSQCEYLSTHGVNQIEKIIKTIKRNINQNIDYKVLVTMYDTENIHSEVIYSKLKDMYKEKTFTTIIDHDVKIKESQIMNTPVMYYDKSSISAQQYLDLAKEIVGK